MARSGKINKNTTSKELTKSGQRSFAFNRALTKASDINLGGLTQLSGLEINLELINANASASYPYWQSGSPRRIPAGQPVAYPLSHATIQTVLLLLSDSCALATRLFSKSEEQRIEHCKEPISNTIVRSTGSAWPSDRSSAATASQRTSLCPPALTLSAPVSGASNLILAERTSRMAIASQTLSANGATQPALNSTIHQQQSNNPIGDLKTASRPTRRRKGTRGSALAISSAAINCLMAVSPLLSLAQTTTSYGTGESSTIYSGGTINPGDTVILNNGASVTGNTTINGTLQFNQSANLTINNAITGNGTLSLTNTGILSLTNWIIPWTIGLDLGVSVVTGSLYADTDGSDNLSIGFAGYGSLTITGGRVYDANGFLGYSSGSTGHSEVSAGNWSNWGDLYVGNSGNGSLTISGGIVDNWKGYLGTNSGSRGNATVQSGTWTNRSDLYIGNSGNGSLTISGGNVTSANSIIGRYAGSSGNATITAGRWDNTGSLTVGDAANANGTLTIHGGNLTNVHSYIGNNAESIGKAIISAGNWTNSSTLLSADQAMAHWRLAVET